MAIVLLGNTAPVETPAGLSVSVNGEEPTGRTPVAGNTTVIVSTPDTDVEGNPVPLDKQLLEVRNAFKVHSDGNAAWVEGHNDFFNQAVSRVFGCPVGRPDNWDASVSPQEPVSAPSTVPSAEVVDEVHITVQDVAPVPAAIVSTPGAAS